MGHTARPIQPERDGYLRRWRPARHGTVLGTYALHENTITFRAGPSWFAKPGTAEPGRRCRSHLPCCLAGRLQGDDRVPLLHPARAGAPARADERAVAAGRAGGSVKHVEAVSTRPSHHAASYRTAGVGRVSTCDIPTRDSGTAGWEAPPGAGWTMTIAAVGAPIVLVVAIVVAGAHRPAGTVRSRRAARPGHRRSRSSWGKFDIEPASIEVARERS